MLRSLLQACTHRSVDGRHVRTLMHASQPAVGWGGCALQGVSSLPGAAALAGLPDAPYSQLRRTFAHLSDEGLALLSVRGGGEERCIMG